MERIDVDVAVVGSGFAGALTALCLRQRGRRVALVERGRHPRFAIGESTTPLTNLLLEELADRYDLPRIRPLSKWGTWQRARPDIACGLKRGFTFYFHRPGERFPGDDDRDRARQLLVAASPHDAIADTHWYRPDFDQALIREAEASGAIYLDETQIDGIRREGGQAILDGVRHGRSLRITAPFVIDASGPRGFLHRALGLAERPLRWLPHTHGVYTHFEQVARWDDLHRLHGDDAPAPDCARPDVPPYPPDDAALHHVFEGGWIWMLRFNNGITSAGAALTDDLFARLTSAGNGKDSKNALGDGSASAALGTDAMPAARRKGDIAADGAARVWERLLAMLPSVREQFADARPTLPFVHAPRLAFRSADAAGHWWAMLPSAVGVIDPLLSTGFPLTLLGMTRLLDLLEHTSDDSDERRAALAAYARATQDELDVTEQLVAALYASMTNPPLFKRLGLLYFAAASFSEAVRRLGRPALAPGFLLCNHPRFGPELRACAKLAREGHADEALYARIDRAVEPFDTAGLLDRSRRDWYPMLAGDLVANAAKLEATTEEIDRLLERCGLRDRSDATASFT